MMLTCRQVSTLVSTGTVSAQSINRRFGVWLHLSMCRHCRAFWRGCRRLDRDLRIAIDRGPGSSAPADLAVRAYERLLRES